MRHVSRTYRVALDWLFDRVNLEPQIQIKCVDTKNQLAEMLTKGSFSRDEWDHFLCVFDIEWDHFLCVFDIMNFSMYSWSHFIDFLSKRVDKRMFRKQPGNWCRRIKTKQNVMRENILTPHDQGILLHHSQNWERWNTREQIFQTEEVRNVRTAWKQWSPMYWYGECSWLRRWKPPFILGQIVWKFWKWTRTRNWGNSEFIQYHTETDLGTFWRDSDCDYDIESTSLSWTRSLLSHDEVIQWTKAKVRVYSDSVLCLEKMSHNAEAITRWNSQVEEFKMSAPLKRIVGNRWRSNWIRVEYFQGFTSLQILQKIEPDKFTDRIIFMSMFNDIDWTQKKKRWDLYFEFRESQDIREEILAGTLDVLRSWRWRVVVWKSKVPSR